MLSWDVCHMSLCLFLVLNEATVTKHMQELPLCIWHIDYCVSVCARGRVCGDLKYKCAFIESAPSVSRSSWFVLMCSEEQLGELPPSIATDTAARDDSTVTPVGLQDVDRKGLELIVASYHSSVSSTSLWQTALTTTPDSLWSFWLLIRSFTELNCYSLIR